jgi:hypothetical protein
MHRARLIATTMAAAVVLAAMVATASAQRFESSNQSIRATYPQLRFTLSVEEITVTCPITIEGTFHSRTIAKEAERLVGYITRAIRNEERCVFTGGAEGFTMDSTSLPWHIRYESFTGTLPTITRFGVRSIGHRFRFRAIGVTCVFGTSVALPGKGVAERNTTTGQITSLAADPSARTPRIEGSMFCPADGVWEGSAAVRVLGSTTTLIFVRLI